MPRHTSAAHEREAIRQSAVSDAGALKKDLASRRRLLTPRQQLKAFESDAAEGHPRLKALIESGKVETARQWLNAMKRIKGS